MAFNQASFFLFPPKFGPVVEFDHSAKTGSGKPLEIIYSNVINTAAPKVLTDHMRQWLVDRGFHEKKRYGGSQILFRDRQTTFLGTQEVVDLALPLDEDEIQELHIRFLLTEHTPNMISEWRDLISELGHDFGFQLMSEDHQLLPCVDFVTVLKENWNFRSFQENYGWQV